MRRATAWTGLILVVAIAFAVVLVPAWMIYPFRSQSQQGIELSYFLRRWSPILTIVFLASAAAIALGLWRSTRRWWRRSILVIAVAAAILPVWLARQNHFEWMFQPLKGPEYAKAHEASFMEDGDMVLAVAINGESVAYPVRQLAYHHLVQDDVGGVPLVVTY
jgi:hypothetical protein